MANTYFIERSPQLPEGWTTMKLSSNNYTDSDITYLYQLFTCCFGDLMAQKINQAIQGNPVGYECMANEKFMDMGIDLLRTWYNTATTNSFTFPIAFVPSTEDAVVVIYFVPSIGSELNSNIIVSSGFVVYYPNYAPLLEAIQAALPVGYTATLNGSSITINFPPNFIFPYNYVWVNQIQGGEPTNNTWYNALANQLSYQNCIPLTTVQTIVEQMFKICGCVNCKNTAQVEQDTPYISLGLTNNAPSGQINI